MLGRESVVDALPRGVARIAQVLALSSIDPGEGDRRRGMLAASPHRLSLFSRGRGRASARSSPTASRALQTRCRRGRRPRRALLLRSSTWLNDRRRHLEWSPPTVPGSPASGRLNRDPCEHVRPPDVGARPSSRPVERLSGAGLGASREGVAPEPGTAAWRSSAPARTPAPPSAKRIVGRRARPATGGRRSQSCPAG